MLLKIYPENPNMKAVTQVVDLLRDGGVVIYPTDTLYAIGCDALNVRAVERICKIKGRDPKRNNLSISCSDLSSISEYVKVNDSAFKVLKSNLPGPFTFILPTGSELPKIYKNRKEVGVRMPDHPIVQLLARELGHPLMSMSIRSEEELEDEAYMTHPELIHERYEQLVDLVIDGGEGSLLPSTVVNCTEEPYVVLRQGRGVLEW